MGSSMQLCGDAAMPRLGLSEPSSVSLLDYPTLAADNIQDYVASGTFPGNL